MAPVAFFQVELGAGAIDFEGEAGTFRLKLCDLLDTLKSCLCCKKICLAAPY